MAGERSGKRQHIHIHIADQMIPEKSPLCRSTAEKKNKVIDSYAILSPALGPGLTL